MLACAGWVIGWFPLFLMLALRVVSPGSLPSLQEVGRSSARGGDDVVVKLV